MNIIRSMLVCGVASSVLVGCTTHPLPEDVTRKNTYAIVQKIRCEAREAVKQELIAVLLQSSYPHTRELGEDLASGRLRPEKLVFADIDDPEARDLVSKYSQAAIAHEFEFTISEGSDNTASLTLKDPLTNGGMFTLDLTGGHKRTRKNVRNFITSDTFGAMFDKKSYMVCAKFPASKEKDWIYPITGSIGTAELIHTFLLLSENANLYDKGVTRDATHVTRTISDNLSFGPGLTLMPQTQSLELTAASGGGQARPLGPARSRHLAVDS
jgi:hypothetical protein